MSFIISSPSPTSSLHRCLSMKGSPRQGSHRKAHLNALDCNRQSSG
ncbi:unnamed protein product, partial [Vitis vinifera]